MPKYVSLLKKTESLWPDNIFGNALKEELDKEKRLFEKLFRMYRVTIMSTAFIYTTKPLVLFTKTLPTVWYVPCDTEKLACYVVVVTSQCLWVYLLGMSIVCYDAFFFGILYQAYKELEKIKYGFKNFEVNENKEKIDEAQMQKKFASIVEYHNYILEYINDINGIFRLQLLNHFLTVICTICFGIFFLNIDGFPPSHDKLIRYVPYLLSYHFQAYIYCVSGEVLSAQVMSVAVAVFDSNWHLNHQPNLTKGICLVMQISQIGKQLSIGDLWDLNLATFGGVIKTSMTFNTFMQTVYNTN